VHGDVVKCECEHCGIVKNGRLNSMSKDNAVGQRCPLLPSAEAKLRSVILCVLHTPLIWHLSGLAIVMPIKLCSPM